MLSPRPLPRQKDAVVVMAQEALATAALCWQERAERLVGANLRLKSRLVEVENAHRKSLTVVKNVPALPNNHLFTKQLVNENHTLRKEVRSLQQRLMQFEGPRSKKPSNNPNKNIRSPLSHSRARIEHEVSVAIQNKFKSKGSKIAQQKAKAFDNNSLAKTAPANSSLVELVHHPILTKLKASLKDLEVDLIRLRQENDLLRNELKRYTDQDTPGEFMIPAKKDGDSFGIKENDFVQQKGCVDAITQRVKVLEARYEHLKRKACTKNAVYQETVSRLDEISKQLFEAREQLAAQSEKLQVHRDQSALTADLQQEIHFLKSENMKLNETIVTLSSRPFDTVSKELQKKNLWIAQVEEEKRVLGGDLARFHSDCITSKQINDQLLRRVGNMTAEIKDLADELSQTKAECEQAVMKKEVALLQLRFYTSPDDHDLMCVVGKALKDMKKRQMMSSVGCEAVTSDRSSNEEEK